MTPTVHNLLKLGQFQLYPSGKRSWKEANLEVRRLFSATSFGREIEAGIWRLTSVPTVLLIKVASGTSWRFPDWSGLELMTIKGAPLLVIELPEVWEERGLELVTTEVELTKLLLEFGLVGLVGKLIVLKLVTREGLIDGRLVGSSDFFVVVTSRPDDESENSTKSWKKWSQLGIF